MPLSFVSESGRTEIVGLGVIGDGGRAGIPISEAANSLSELQSAEQEPLHGKELEQAARAFAEARGFKVENVKESDLEEESSLPSVPEAAQTEAERVRALNPSEKED
jgi:hypothetical protein